MKPRHGLVGAAVPAILLAGAAMVWRVPLTMAVLPLAAAHRLAVDTTRDLPDGRGELLPKRRVAGANRLPVPVHGPQGVAQFVDGPLRVGRDADLFSLPAGTTTIRLRNLF